MTSDRALVNDVLARKRGAFERLVAEHQRLCWHIIYRMVQSPEDTRDLCQETFLRIHQRLHQFRNDYGLKSWIGKVAYTIALRHLESRRVPIAYTEDWADAEFLMESHPSDFDLERACVDEDLVQRVQHQIDRLPPLLRTVLTLYYLEELSIPDIGEITGLASGTIKSHLFRARLQLRHSMDLVKG